MPEMFACFTNCGEGGNTRFSCSTDSIVDAIAFSSWKLAQFCCASTYTALTLSARLNHDHPTAGTSGPERRGRSAVHLVLPPGGLHPGAGTRVRARAIAGGKGRHR